MNDLAVRIQDLLGKQLGAEGYDVVDLVPIPARGDRMVRIRTLEEALDDFDGQDTGEAVSYLVQVRVRPRTAPAAAVAAVKPAVVAVTAPADESIFAQLVNETYAHHDRFSMQDAREPAVFERPATPPKPSLDGIYLPNGKLNSRYLQQNAELLFASGDYPLARNIYKTILQTGERSHLAHYWIARCFEAEGRLPEAISHYEESVTYHPSLDAYQHWAALLIRGKKDHEAAEIMERALALRELPKATLFELHKACGNCWMRAERPENAERHYTKALELDAMADGVRANIGALYLGAGKIAEAKRYFQDAAASNARNDKALAGLGSCYLAEGEKRQAHDCFARALDIQLQNPTAIFYLVKCAYEIKSYATAARIVGEYVQSAPVNTNLLYSLAGLQFHLGRVAEAGATARKILELQPRHAGAADLMRIIDRYAGA